MFIFATQQIKIKYPQFMQIPYHDPADNSKPLEQKDASWVSPDGNAYPVVNAIPRFVSYNDQGQEQTSNSFGYKWNKQQDWGIKVEHDDINLVWSIWKDFYGWNGPEDLRKLVEGKVVLDAGCGSGTSIHRYIDWPELIVGADISTAVDACYRNFGNRKNLQLVQADLTKLPFADKVFDVIWSNGVLHHTPDTHESLRQLTRHLKTGGLMIFYIYVKKAPIREFVDDHIRNEIKDLPEEQAWQRMEVLTKIGKTLSDLKAKITIDEDFPELGFKKGTYDLQRFMYYNMFKCYWNDGISFDDNVHVNFDWYHPTYSHRHTPEEVKGWLKELHYEEQYMHVSESGIAVIAKRLD